MDKNKALVFLGDINFQTIPNIDSKLSEFLAGKIVIANFEGYLAKAHNPSTLGVSEGNFAHMIKALNVGYLNIANNHIFDGGRGGFEQTIKILKRYKITYFGLRERPSVIIKLGNFKVGVLSFAWRMTGAKGNIINVCWLKCSKILKQTKELKRVTDFVVVYPHWGIDMETLPQPWQVFIAQQLLKHGADLIIGHHPHVIQPIQERVFYSIGNTYLPENEVTRYQRKAANSGLAVMLQADDGTIKIEVNATKFSNSQIYLDSGPDIKSLEYSGDYTTFFRNYRRKKMVPIFAGKINDYFFALPLLLLLEKIVSIKPIMNFLRKRRKTNI